jgi:hypothetical protein
MGDAVQASDGVVAEERVGAARQGEVMTQVGGGLGQVRGRQGVSGGDPLIESGVMSSST